MFPAIRLTCGNASLTFLMHLKIFEECPCAESSTRTSTCDATRASTLSRTSFVMPIAAPARSLPLESFAEFGYFTDFSISFIVISPLRLPFLSTMGSFSILCVIRIFLASSRVVPSGAVIRFSLVITYFIGFEKSVSNLKSRFVSIPTSLPFSVIGTPEILYFPIISSASCKVCSGERWNGSTITPCSDLLTLSTSTACASIDIFLWITPIPPSLAIAIASADSVTVSIAALIIGMLSVISFVSLVVRSISLGRTSLFCGISSTSSNVRPSKTNLSFIIYLP